MSYKLQVLSSRDYDKLAKKYPANIGKKIINSKGFTDTKRNISFVRNKRDKTELAGTAIHEIIEMAATVSEHDINGIRFKGGDSEPEVKTVTPEMTPEQQEFYSETYKPYYESQFKQYKDIFEPSSRQLGGELQSQLTQPLQLPEDVWSKTWQKARERTLGEFEPIERQATQRIAGRGGLEASGAAGGYFEKLDVAKAKSIETLAIDQAIAEWSEKKQAKQQSTENMFRYLGYQPSFDMQLPANQYFMTQGQEDGGLNWGGAATGAISGATAGSAFGPWGTGVGAAVGGVAGAMS